jgi:5'-deoxynucleotidase YfbR-like HD superfamily hydrolase
VKRNPRKQFVICIYNKGYTASLELRKIYEQIPDRKAERHGLVRIADEEDEALYPERYFIPVDLPRDLEEAIEAAAELELQHR